MRAGDKATGDENNRQMTINKYTPIHRILAAYPQLIHRLVERIYSSNIEKLLLITARKGTKQDRFMPIFYNKAARENPSAPKEADKWYPVLRSTGMLKEREVAKLIAGETTLNPKEAEMALSQLQKVIIRTLINGQSMQLGDWGSLLFSPPL